MIMSFATICVGGPVAARLLKMPSLVGEIFAGILLGPNHGSPPAATHFPKGALKAVAKGDALAKGVARSAAPEDRRRRCGGGSGGGGGRGGGRRRNAWRQRRGPEGGAGRGRGHPPRAVVRARAPRLPSGRQGEHEQREREPRGRSRQRREVGGDSQEPEHVQSLV